MGGLILFTFNGTKKTPSKKSGDIRIKPDGWGADQVNCYRKKEMPITKELLEEAFNMMEDLPRKNDDIIIESREVAEKIHLFPNKFTSSIVYGARVFKYPPSVNTSEQSKKDCIEYLKQLPNFINKVNFNLYKKWENPEDVIKAIPKHITHFTINAEVIENCTYEELIPFFSSFPNNIKEITLLGGNPQKKQAIDDKVLRDLIIRLPVSVKTLTVPKDMSLFSLTSERTIDLIEYRKKEYFPDSYNELTHSSSEDLFERAKNLLKDYTKDDSWSPGFALFATFHWNRHHADKVNGVLQKSNNLDDLLKRLSEIEMQENFNPTGSLARRICYIKNMQYQAAELNTEVESLNAATHI